jgi:hypothetical protein
MHLRTPVAALRPLDGNSTLLPEGPLAATLLRNQSSDCSFYWHSLLGPRACEPFLFADLVQLSGVGLRAFSRSFPLEDPSTTSELPPRRSLPFLDRHPADRSPLAAFLRLFGS